MTEKMILVKAYFDSIIILLGEEVKQMKLEAECGSFVIVGGRICLNFLNTQVRKPRGIVDLISTPNQLRQWLVAANLISPEASERLSRQWQEGDNGRSARQQTVELRAFLRPIMEALIAGQPVPSASIERLNSVLHGNPAYLTLRYDEEGRFTQEAQFDTDKMYDWIPVIAQDTADFLCHADHSLLKQCDGVGCIRLFYDTTKNHKRRWCSVEKCGRQAKAAAYYRRTKEAKNEGVCP